MNGFAIVVGYIVIGLVILLVLAVAVGKFFDRKQDYKLEFEDWDPAPRTLTPLVSPSWQPTEEQLRELESRDTRTPSDPAS